MEKKSRWVWDDDWQEWYCIECTEPALEMPTEGSVRTPYCPNCGAEMENPEEWLC